MTRRAVGFLVAALPVLFTAAVAFAAGDGGGHDVHGGHGGAPSQEQWILLACTVFNFSLFVFLMKRFTGRPLSDFLQGRRRGVKDAIEAAAKAKAEADALKAEYEAKAAALENTREAMIEEMRGIAEADRVKALAAARESVERLMRDAERTAQSDLERAMRQLRTEAVSIAAEAARTEIVKRLGAGDHQRLLNEFLQGVDRQR